jgi:hypothetical protein
MFQYAQTTNAYELHGLLSLLILRTSITAKPVTLPAELKPLQLICCILSQLHHICAKSKMQNYAMAKILLPSCFRKMN